VRQVLLGELLEPLVQSVLLRLRHFFRLGHVFSLLVD
jgi:hypothetical protein